MATTLFKRATLAVALLTASSFALAQQAPTPVPPEQPAAAQAPAPTASKVHHKAKHKKAAHHKAKKTHHKKTHHKKAHHKAAAASQVQ
ncbi:MAG TPA: signal peptidase [Aquabacterium sp.]|nr:signal peptidase [Aquabacterium sp.]